MCIGTQSKMIVRVATPNASILQARGHARAKPLPPFPRCGKRPRGGHFTFHSTCFIFHLPYFIAPEDPFKEIGNMEHGKSKLEIALLSHATVLSVQSHALNQIQAAKRRGIKLHLAVWRYPLLNVLKLQVGLNDDP